MESTRKVCACGCLEPVNPQQKWRPGHKKATSSHARYWSKINKTETCWLWTAGRTTDGYARHFHNGKGVQAHRLAYEFEYGPIPEGSLVDHACGVRSCVNPTHLRLANNSQNAENLTKLRADNKSGFRGVSFCNQAKKWRSEVRHKGKKYYGGHFDNPEDAGEASRQLRIKLFTYNVIDRQSAA